MTNVKFVNIISDVFRVSGQAMIGVRIPGAPVLVEEVADLSARRLRQRIPELIEALRDHQMNGHSRWLIAHSVEHAVLLDRQMEAAVCVVTDHSRNQDDDGGQPTRRDRAGDEPVSVSNASVQLGSDLSGEQRAGGKGKSSRIKRGSEFLLAARVQTGWAAARKKDSICQRKFHRWMNRLGAPKANIAIAHSVLEVVYAVLRNDRPYREPGAAVMHEKEKAKLVRHHAKLLRQLGADGEMLEQLVERLTQPDACSTPPPEQASMETWDFGLARPEYRNIQF